MDCVLHCFVDICTGVDAWSLIPDEIFLAVFAYLPKSTLCRCARVSKRWRRLAYVVYCTGHK